MKLIEPKVELWSEEGVTPKEHIARCAAVCYDSHPKDPKKLVDGLIRNGHLSMLRHSSMYFQLDCPEEKIQEVAMSWDKDPFASFYWDGEGLAFLSVNRQYERENGIGWKAINLGQILELCKETPELFDIIRLTFCLTTQISTSRELNRVSPNNIAERSTRYCSSKNGLEICKPWWWNESHAQVIAFEAAYPEQEAYLAWTDAEEHYQRLLGLGMKPEDARGVLPLDTATKVVYTYSVKEWKHILDLRYYGKTGKPHPNCKLIMGMVRDEVNQFAKEHDINYQL